MSNDNTEDSPFAGLDSLNLGPAWARDKDDTKKDKYSKYETSERGDAKKGDKRRGGGSGPRNNDQRGQGRGGDRRNDRNDRGGKFNNQRRDSRPPRVEAPAWIDVAVMPVEESLDNLANEIKSSARSYQVFDLSRTVLKERNRFRVIFQSKDQDKKLYRVREDNSVWLSREEALKQVFGNEETLGTYYKKFSKEVEAPAGNYTSVARCGFSGKLLGPPNFHEYQQTVARIHREEFSNMSLEAYKNRIKTEQSEEAVAQWLEEAKTLNYYVPLSELPKEEVVETPVVAEAEVVEASTEEVEGAPTEEAEAAPEAVETEEVVAEVTEVAPAVEETPKTELTTPQALERHFLENYYMQAIEESAKSWVLGDIEGKKLSPALLVVLKNVVSEERRYPGKLSAILCRQMSGRHIAVYKWESKLRAGPARPKAVPSNISLSDRIETLLEWVQGNSGSDIKSMWAKLLPGEVDEDTKHLWYADLHWLINQGYVIFTADGHLHLAKARGSEPEAPQEKAKTEPKAEVEAPTEEVKAEPVAAEAPEAEAKSEPETTEDEKTSEEA